MQMHILIIVLIFAMGLLYWFPLRKWFLSWGTSPQELSRQLAPGFAFAQDFSSLTSSGLCFDAWTRFGCKY